MDISRLGRIVRPLVRRTGSERARRSGRWPEAAHGVVARHRWLGWFVVAAAAGAASWAHLAVTAAADAERDRWGSMVEVVVAVEPAAPGDAVAGRSRLVPRAVVPSGAVTEPSDVGVVRRHVGVGEILVEADLAPGTGVFALVPSGSVVVAVDDPLMPDPPVGVRVVVTSEGVVLTERGVIVAVTADAVQVAVPSAEAAVVAAAAGLRSASLLVPSELDQSP